MADDEKVGGAIAEDRAQNGGLASRAAAILLGVFLVLHILANASALGGQGTYDAFAGTISRWKGLPVLELVLVVAPLLLHADYGLRLFRPGTLADDEGSRYGGRRLWLAQRISAAVGLVFLIVHLWELRAQRLFFGLSADALYTTLTARLSWTWGGVPWIALFYLVGLLAVVAFAVLVAIAAYNTLVAPSRQQVARVATVGLGVVLFAAGSATLIGLATGTRLLSGPDDDSGAPKAPCGVATTPISKPSSAPSR